MWKLLRSGLQSFNSILADIYCSSIRPAELVDSFQFVLNICGCFCECMCVFVLNVCLHYTMRRIWGANQIHSLGASSVVAIYCPIPPCLTLFLLFFHPWFTSHLQIQFVFWSYLHFLETQLFTEYTNITHSVYTLSIC